MDNLSAILRFTWRCASDQTLDLLVTQGKVPAVTAYGCLSTSWK